MSLLFVLLLPDVLGRQRHTVAMLGLCSCMRAATRDRMFNQTAIMLHAFAVAVGCFSQL